MRVRHIIRYGALLDDRAIPRNMYYLYISKLSNGNLYTGSIGDLKKRYAEHSNGKVESIKHKRPLKLIHYEAYCLKTDASRREKFLKTTEGKRLLRQQIRDILDKRP